MKKRIYPAITAWSFLVLIGSVMFIKSVAAQPPTKSQLSQARKLSEQGDKFFRRKNYKMAIDRYKKAAAIVPRVPVLQFNLGTSHYYEAEYPQATEALTKALELGYKPIDVYSVRWYVLYKSKDFDGAMADIQSALKLQPNEAFFLLAAGDVYREKSMDKEAVAAYEKAAQFNPKNPDIYYFMAFCYARMGDLANQSAAAQKALEKGTRFLGESWLLIANSAQKSKKYSDAVEAYEKAISANPRLVDGFNNLSQIYQTLNRLDDAITVSRRGLVANPNNGSIYTNLSWYYSLADRHTDAVVAGKKAVELSPQQSMGYTNLCRAYNDIGEYTLAIQTCEGALKISPDDGETCFYMARSYEFLKQDKLAAQYYAKAVKGLAGFTKGNPDNSEGFYLLGNAYFAVGQNNNAIGAYKRCLQLSPGFSKAIYNLGYTYFISGDMASARLQYNDLLKIDAKLAEKLLQAIQAK